MKMSRLVYVFLASLAILVPTAAQNPITIRFSNAYAKAQDPGLSIATAYAMIEEKLKPSVIVKQIVVPGTDNYIPKIKLMFAAKDIPDVIETQQYDLISEALKYNVITEIGPLLAADPEWRSFVSQDVIEANTAANGKIYGLTNQRSVIGYFYNKTLFAKAGIKPAATWEEFWKNCDALKKAGITPMSLDTNEGGWQTMLLFGAIVASSGERGAAFMNTPKPRDYKLPEVIAAAKAIQKALADYTTKGAIGGGYQQGAGNFLNERTAMMFNGNWFISDIEDETKAVPGLASRVGFAMYPGNVLYVESSMGIMLGNTGDSAHREAAAKWLKAYCSPEVQAMFLEKAKQIPASSLVKISPEFAAANPLLAAHVEAANKAKIKIKDYQLLWFANVSNDTVSQQLPMLAFKNLTPEGFAQKLTEAAAKNK